MAKKYDDLEKKALADRYRELLSREISKQRGWETEEDKYSPRTFGGYSQEMEGIDSGKPIPTRQTQEKGGFDIRTVLEAGVEPFRYAGQRFGETTQAFSEGISVKEANLAGGKKMVEGAQSFWEGIKAIPELLTKAPQAVDIIGQAFGAWASGDEERAKQILMELPEQNTEAMMGAPAGLVDMASGAFQSTIGTAAAGASKIPGVRDVVTPVAGGLAAIGAIPEGIPRSAAILTGTDPGDPNIQRAGEALAFTSLGGKFMKYPLEKTMEIFRGKTNATTKAKIASNIIRKKEGMSPALYEKQLTQTLEQAPEYLKNNIDKIEYREMGGELVRGEMPKTIAGATNATDSAMTYLWNDISNKLKNADPELRKIDTQKIVDDMINDFEALKQKYKTVPEEQQFLKMYEERLDALIDSYSKIDEYTLNNVNNDITQLNKRLNQSYRTGNFNDPEIALAEIRVSYLKKALEEKLDQIAKKTGDANINDLRQTYGGLRQLNNTLAKFKYQEQAGMTGLGGQINNPYAYSEVLSGLITASTGQPIVGLTRTVKGLTQKQISDYISQQKDRSRMLMELFNEEGTKTTRAERYGRTGRFTEKALSGEDAQLEDLMLGGEDEEQRY